jgi:hypothetical protein
LLLNKRRIKLNLPRLNPLINIFKLLALTLKTNNFFFKVTKRTSLTIGDFLFLDPKKPTEPVEIQNNV